MLGTISLGVLLVSLKLSDQAPGSKHSALHLHPEPSPLVQPSLPGPGQGPEGTLPRPSARAMPMDAGSRLQDVRWPGVGRGHLLRRGAEWGQRGHRNLDVSLHLPEADQLAVNISPFLESESR